MQNSNLNTQLGSLNGQSSGVNFQLSSLQAEVAASTTALTAQVSSLNGETQELQTELSFLCGADRCLTTGATSTADLKRYCFRRGKVRICHHGHVRGKDLYRERQSSGVVSALTPLLGTAIPP